MEGARRLDGGDDAPLAAPARLYKDGVGLVSAARRLAPRFTTILPPRSRADQMRSGPSDDTTAVSSRRPRTGATIRPGEVVACMARPAVMLPYDLPSGIETKLDLARATITTTTTTRRYRRRSSSLHATATVTKRTRRMMAGTGTGTGVDVVVVDVEPASSPFERLPREVRTLVYRHLLLRPGPLRPLSHEDRYLEAPGTARPPGLAEAVPLLRTCRRVYAEAAEVLYGQNDFVLYALDYGDAALAFLHQIGSRNRRAIRSLELDWQHGIHRIDRTSKANELFAMMADLNHPLRTDLTKMLRDLGRTTVGKFVTTLELMLDSPSLERLTLLWPEPSHSDGPPCLAGPEGSQRHQEIRRVLSRFRRLKTLTVGYTDARHEFEATARLMGVRELNVTELDLADFPTETVDHLPSDGWTIVTIAGQDPDADECRRIFTKRFVDAGA